MIEHFVNAFSAIKQATPTLLLGTAFATGSLLFLPESLVNALSLTGVLRDSRQYLGITLLVSIAMLVAQSLVAGWVLAKGVYSKRKSRRSEKLAEEGRLEILKSLTPEEKAYLIPYIASQKSTQYFSITDGIAAGLQAKGIIFRSTNVSNMVGEFAFNLYPWAREQLANNMHLLELRGVRAPESSPRS